MLVQVIVFFLMIIALVKGLGALISGKYKVKNIQISGTQARLTGIIILSPIILGICLFIIDELLFRIKIKETFMFVVFGILLVSSLIVSGIYAFFKTKK